jgi:hypothetical protein
MHRIFTSGRRSKSRSCGQGNGTSSTASTSSRRLQTWDAVRGKSSARISRDSSCICSSGAISQTIRPAVGGMRSSKIALASRTASPHGESQSAPAVAHAASGVLSACPAQSRPPDTPAPGHLPRDVPLDGGAGPQCRLLAGLLLGAQNIASLLAFVWRYCHDRCVILRVKDSPTRGRGCARLAPLAWSPVLYPRKAHGSTRDHGAAEGESLKLTAALLGPLARHTAPHGAHARRHCPS